jgi:hypothetical protein
MIPKKPALGPRSEGGNRFTEKVMLKQQAKAKCRFNQNQFRFSAALLSVGKSGYIVRGA